MMAGRRGFGNVRKLPSGRYQVRYRGPDGLMRSGPCLFDRKRDAELFLDDVRSTMARGEWLDPDAGKVPFEVFGQEWLSQRKGLSPTTMERYESAFRLQLLPELGHLTVGEISSAVVRRWHTYLLENGTGWPSAAKAYRVLRAMMNTAVDDGLIRRNPCRITGAGDDRSPERPVLSVPEVAAVVSKIDKRYQMMVLLAAFTTLRFGELTALRRCDVDEVEGWVTVRQAQVELKTGELVVKEPKSSAGRRRVGIPSDLLPAVQWHLDTYAESGADGRLFVGPKGGYVRRQNFRRTWSQAMKLANVPAVHFHDLRHTGNTLAALNGANLRELMERMGHTSTRAAVIYLHAANGRDRQLADAMNSHIAGRIELPGDEQDA